MTTTGSPSRTTACAGAQYRQLMTIVEMPGASSAKVPAESVVARTGGAPGRRPSTLAPVMGVPP